MIYIHKTADIHKSVKIGDRSKIWHNVQIRKGAVIGKQCILGKDAYIDHDVHIGNNCRIQNQTSIYYQTTIEQDVFIGPHVCILNDKIPRAVMPDGSPKRRSDWVPGKTVIKRGASIGAGSIILPNLTVGRWAMVGAGSVVTNDVSDYALVFGNPSRLKHYVCRCGNRLYKKVTHKYECSVCHRKITF